MLELLKICENVKIISLLERMKIEESDEDLQGNDEYMTILLVLVRIMPQKLMTNGKFQMKMS